MMGQLPAAQNALFYDFSLEQHIPDNHCFLTVRWSLNLFLNT
jgi:hypothetical protein